MHQSQVKIMFVYHLFLLLDVQDLVELVHDAANSVASGTADFFELEFLLGVRVLVHEFPLLFQIAWRRSLEHKIERLGTIEETLFGLLPAWSILELIVCVAAALFKELVAPWA